VISQQDKTVTRIDPERRAALRTIPVGGPPVDIAVGAGAVWVLVSGHTDAGLRGGSARVARIDPRLNNVLEEIPLGIGPRGFGSTASLAAAGEAVWVANPEPNLPVSRIDAATNEKTATFSVGGTSRGFNSGTAGGVPGGSGIAVGEGAVWVGTDLGVIRISTSSNSASEKIPLGVAVPTALAVGEGSVWVAAGPGFRCCPPKAVGTGTLTRIDPTTNTVDATIDVGGEPIGVAVGEGSIWIADAGTRSILRVDPEKTRVVARIRVGARPRGIAFGDGFVWVAVS
jgi:YVTN family beta-propeller protein